MNILYISYDGMTDPLGQSQVIPYLIGLTECGHSITLISCEKKNKFKENGRRIKALLSSKAIAWEPVDYSSSPSIFGKQKNIAAIRRKAKNVVKKKQIDLVHCRSYMAALIGLELKQKHKLKFVFDMRGFWADERIDGEIWSKNNPVHRMLYAYFKKKEYQFLKHADYTISLTEKAKAEIKSWKGLINIPIEVIPCCVDLELFDSKESYSGQKDTLKEDLGIPKDTLVISYLGSIGTWYMIDEMLDFFNALLKVKPNATFLFITPDNPNDILRLAANKNIPIEAIVIHSVARSQVPKYLHLSDISLYLIKPLYSKQASSPTKTGEIMAMGIPLITNAGIGDSDAIIKNTKSGLLINEFSNAEYNRIIHEIETLLKSDHKIIRQGAKEYFSLQNGVQKYNAVYKKLAK